MVRTVLLLLLAIVLISLLRGVIGIVGKAIGNLGQPSPPAPKPDQLKRDPVCGVYIPAASAVKRTIGGEVVHFCSENCARAFRGQAT